MSAESEAAQALAGSETKPPRQLLPDFPPVPEQLKQAFPEMKKWEEDMVKWTFDANHILNGDGGS